MKILVLNSYCYATEDNFKNGEDPDTSRYFNFKEYTGVYDSFEDLCDNADLPKDKNCWSILDKGHIVCHRLEDSSGNEIKVGDKDFALFKEGKKILYAVTYNFHIQFIKEQYVPSIKEIAELLSIEES
jgi:hypothetical protein